MPDEACYACGSERWWLLDGVVWRCDGCHPPVGTPTRKARPGRITFTVASHHWDNAGFLADSNAFTIMARIPEKHGWTEDRNLFLFAAESETVEAYRRKEITTAQYTQQFSSLMQERLPRIRNWLWQHDGQHVTLLCACPGHSLDERFCHRYLVARLLVWLGCEQVAWEATRQERQVAA